MIDFNNKGLFKLKPEDTTVGYQNVKELLINGETVIDSYVSMRDRVVFTNKRIISINVQGITGTKKDYIGYDFASDKQSAAFLMIEGNAFVYDDVDSAITEAGAVVHSVDSVSAGKRLVEEVETFQDR
jgi:hypothetical protein